MTDENIPIELAAEMMAQVAAGAGVVIDPNG
jgi:hypothetical protein